MKSELREQPRKVESPERTRSRRYDAPDVDILETEAAIELLADMPGVGGDGVNATVENGVLTIEGIASDSNLKDCKLGYAEFSSVDFKRSFALSDSVDPAAIAATMKDGVLHVVIPKTKEAVPRRIAVQNA